MAFRSDIDWAAIRRDHELGREAEKAIALRHGIAYSAYRRHRDDEGWTRDLQPAVVKATEAALILAAGARAKAKQHTAAAAIKAAGESMAKQQADAKLEEANRDVVAVQAAAAENVTVITRHRNFAVDLFALAQGMGIELVECSKAALNVDQLLQVAVHAQAPTLVLEQLRDAISLTRRLSNLDRLARTVTNIVNIERQAHGLDTSQIPPNAYEAALVALVNA